MLSGSTNFTAQKRFRRCPSSTTWEFRSAKARRTSASIPAACVLLSSPATSGRWPAVRRVFANVDGRGYYRTSYGPDGVKALGEAVRTAALTPVEQTSLLEDVWALVRLNETSIADFLSLSATVSAQLNPAMPTDQINFISDRLVDNVQRPAFERWVRQTLRPALTALGWEPGVRESPIANELFQRDLYARLCGRDPEIPRRPGGSGWVPCWGCRA